MANKNTSPHISIDHDQSSLLPEIDNNLIIEDSDVRDDALAEDTSNGNQLSKRDLSDETPFLNIVGLHGAPVRDSLSLPMVPEDVISAEHDVDRSVKALKLHADGFISANDLVNLSPDDVDPGHPYRKHEGPVSRLPFFLKDLGFKFYNESSLKKALNPVEYQTSLGDSSYPIVPPTWYVFYQSNELIYASNQDFATGNELAKQAILQKINHSFLNALELSVEYSAELEGLPFAELDNQRAVFLKGKGRLAKVIKGLVSQMSSSNKGKSTLSLAELIVKVFKPDLADSRGQFNPQNKAYSYSEAFSRVKEAVEANISAKMDELTSNEAYPIYKDFGEEKGSSLIKSTAVALTEYVAHATTCFMASNAIIRLGSDSVVHLVKVHQFIDSHEVASETHSDKEVFKLTNLNTLIRADLTESFQKAFTNLKSMQGPASLTASDITMSLDRLLDAVSGNLLPYLEKFEEAFDTNAIAVNAHFAQIGHFSLSAQEVNAASDIIASSVPLASDYNSLFFSNTLKLNTENNGVMTYRVDTTTTMSSSQREKAMNNYVRLVENLPNKNFVKFDKKALLSCVRGQRPSVQDQRCLALSYVSPTLKGLSMIDDPNYVEGAFPAEEIRSAIPVQYSRIREKLTLEGFKLDNFSPSQLRIIERYYPDIQEKRVVVNVTKPEGSLTTLMDDVMNTLNAVSNRVISDKVINTAYDQYVSYSNKTNETDKSNYGYWFKNTLHADMALSIVMCTMPVRMVYLAEHHTFGIFVDVTDAVDEISNNDSNQFKLNDVSKTKYTASIDVALILADLSGKLNEISFGDRSKVSELAAGFSVTSINKKLTVLSDLALTPVFRNRDKFLSKNILLSFKALDGKVYRSDKTNKTLLSLDELDAHVSRIEAQYEVARNHLDVFADELDHFTKLIKYMCEIEELHFDALAFRASANSCISSITNMLSSNFRSKTVYDHFNNIYSKGASKVIQAVLSSRGRTKRDIDSKVEEYKRMSATQVTRIVNDFNTQLLLEIVSSLWGEEAWKKYGTLLRNCFIFKNIDDTLEESVSLYDMSTNYRSRSDLDMRLLLGSVDE